MDEDGAPHGRLSGTRAEAHADMARLPEGRDADPDDPSDQARDVLVAQDHLGIHAHRKDPVLHSGRPRVPRRRGRG